MYEINFLFEQYITSDLVNKFRKSNKPSNLGKEIQHTGCILMILGKYEVTTLARKQPVGFDWCHLLPLPGPF